MVYADTSFMTSLLLPDSMSAKVAGTYLSLGRPVLAYSALHAMEIRNSLRANQFAQALQLPAKLRPMEETKRRRAESKLELFLQRGSFALVHADWNAVTERFEELSEHYTPQLGCRTLDILHISFAQELHCKAFVTCDVRQATLAKAAGLKLTLVTL